MLKEDLKNALTKALKEKAAGNEDKVRLATLRSVIAGIQLGETSGKSRNDFDDNEVIAVLRKAANQREATAVTYDELGEADRAARERAEAAVIAEFVPELKSADEVRAIVQTFVSDNGLQGPAAIGAVMKALGQDPTIDNKVASTVARELLTS